jgi:hypothetical protein
MSRITKLLGCCSSNPAPPSPHEDVELETLSPMRPESTSPPHHPLPYLPRCHANTLNPRMLAPLSRTADFVDGGDERRLATFSASWVSEDDDSKSMKYEFVYEGSGRTWPLRRIRVDGRVEDQENGEEVYEMECEDGGDEEAAELDRLVDEEELEARMDGETVRISRARVSTKDDSVTPSQEVLTRTCDIPRKMRIRVRKHTSNEHGEVEQVPVKRFKVRVRAPEKTDNESIYGLPKRQGAVPIATSDVCDELGYVHGVLLPKAATVPCKTTSEPARKDSRNSQCRRIL